MNESESVEKTTENESATKIEDGDGVFSAKVHGAGKITIPKNVRTLFEIEEGDLVLAIIRKRIRLRSSLASSDASSPAPREDQAHEGES